MCVCVWDAGGGRKEGRRGKKAKGNPSEPTNRYSNITIGMIYQSSLRTSFFSATWSMSSVSGSNLADAAGDDLPAPPASSLRLITFSPSIPDPARLSAMVRIAGEPNIAPHYVPSQDWDGKVRRCGGWWGGERKGRYGYSGNDGELSYH